MMLAQALAVAAAVLSQGADGLVTLRLAAVRVHVPAAWEHKVDQGTHRFNAPSGDAYFLLDTGKTAQRMDANVCLQKVTQQLGGDWTKLSIAAAPAARRFELVHNDQTQSDVHEYTYVGCDGATTWSLILRIDGKKHDRYAPLGEKVAQSIEYIRDL